MIAPSSTSLESFQPRRWQPKRLQAGGRYLEASRQQKHQRFVQDESFLTASLSDTSSVVREYSLLRTVNQELGINDKLGDIVRETIIESDAELSASAAVNDQIRREMRKRNILLQELTTKLSNPKVGSQYTGRFGGARSVPSSQISYTTASTPPRKDASVRSLFRRDVSTADWTRTASRSASWDTLSARRGLSTPRSLCSPSPVSCRRHLFTREQSPQRWSWDKPEASFNMSMTMPPSPTPDRDYSYTGEFYYVNPSSFLTSNKRARARSCHESSMGPREYLYTPSPAPATKSPSVRKRKTYRLQAYKVHSPAPSESDTTMPAQLPKDPQPVSCKKRQAKRANEDRAGGDAQAKDVKEGGQGVEKRRSCPPAIGTHKALMDQEELQLLLELKKKNTQLEKLLKGTKEVIEGQTEKPWERLAKLLAARLGNQGTQLGSIDSILNPRIASKQGQCGPCCCRFINLCRINQQSTPSSVPGPPMIFNACAANQVPMPCTDCCKAYCTQTLAPHSPCFNHGHLPQAPAQQMPIPCMNPCCIQRQTQEVHQCPLPSPAASRLACPLTNCTSLEAPTAAASTMAQLPTPIASTLSGPDRDHEGQEPRTKVKIMKEEASQTEYPIGGDAHIVPRQEEKSLKPRKMKSAQVNTSPQMSELHVCPKIQQHWPKHRAKSPTPPQKPKTKCKHTHVFELPMPLKKDDHQWSTLSYGMLPPEPSPTMIHVPLSRTPSTVGKRRTAVVRKPGATHRQENVHQVHLPSPVTESTPERTEGHCFTCGHCEVDTVEDGREIISAQISRDDYCAEQKTSVAYWSSTSRDSQEFPEVKYIHFKDGKIMKKIYLTQDMMNMDASSCSHNQATDTKSTPWSATASFRTPKNSRLAKSSTTVISQKPKDVKKAVCNTEVTEGQAGSENHSALQSTSETKLDSENSKDKSKIRARQRVHQVHAIAFELLRAEDAARIQQQRRFKSTTKDTFPANSSVVFSECSSDLANLHTYVMTKTEVAEGMEFSSRASNEDAHNKSPSTSVITKSTNLKQRGSERSLQDPNRTNDSASVSKPEVCRSEASKQMRNFASGDTKLGSYETNPQVYSMDYGDGYLDQDEIKTKQELMELFQAFRMRHFHKRPKQDAPRATNDCSDVKHTKPSSNAHPLTPNVSRTSTTSEVTAKIKNNSSAAEVRRAMQEALAALRATTEEPSSHELTKQAGRSDLVVSPAPSVQSTTAGDKGKREKTKKHTKEKTSSKTKTSAPTIVGHGDGPSMSPSFSCTSGTSGSSIEQQFLVEPTFLTKKTFTVSPSSPSDSNREKESADKPKEQQSRCPSSTSPSYSEETSASQQHLQNSVADDESHDGERQWTEEEAVTETRASSSRTGGQYTYASEYEITPDVALMVNDILRKTMDACSKRKDHAGVAWAGQEHEHGTD